MPSTVATDSTKIVKQVVFVPSGKILIISHNAVYTTSYCNIYNTHLDSNRIVILENKVSSLETALDSIDENTRTIIKNTVDVDAVPSSTNPLEITKETAGYTAIFRKIGVIGGSMSSGVISFNEGTGSQEKYEYSCIQYIARLCSSEGFNFSRGGMSAHEWLSNASVGGSSDLFNNNPVQMYLIQLGNNDVTFVTPGSSQYDPNYSLGTVNDLNGLGGVFTNTFFGKIGAIIQKIREVQPRAYIFLSTFINGYGTPPSDFDYNQAIRDIVTYYSNPDNRPESDELHYYLIDYFTYGKTWYDYRHGLHYQTTRGSHLTATGYLYWAYQYCTYIDWIIKQNMKDFNDVAFVGTDQYWDGQHD